MDVKTIQTILDAGGEIEVAGARIFKTESGTYACAFWNDARCGFWKTYLTGDIDTIMQEIFSLTGKQ